MNGGFGGSPLWSDQHRCRARGREQSDRQVRSDSHDFDDGARTYLLLNDGKTWVAGGYGTIYSSNPNTMPCTGKCGVLWWDGANAAEYLYARFPVLYPTVARFHVTNSGGTGANMGPYHLMRTGPILRTAGYNGSSSGASSWLRMDPLFHCE
jgi:hypothetical protein